METEPTSDHFTPKKVSHLFTQFFLLKQCVPEDELNRLIEAYKKHLPQESADTVADKKELINKSNKVLRTFGFQIKRVFDAFTNQYFYIFFNEIEDSASNQTIWSQHENSYFFLLVDKIIDVFLSEESPMETDTSSDFDYLSIGNTIAINLTRSVGMSMILGEKLIGNWVNLHWFERNSSGHITLGIRTLTEMSPYLIKKFSLMSCYSCHFVCLFGRKCPKCNIALHKHCSFTSKSQKGVFSCPTCSGTLSELDRIIPPTNSNLEVTTEESEDIMTEQDDDE